MPQNKTIVRQAVEDIFQPHPDYVYNDNAIADFEQALADHILGLPSLQDEKHPNGKNIVNPYICNDCGEPQSEFTRNEIRKQSRQEIAEALGVAHEN